MILKSKYNIGDRVWPITKSLNKVWEPCAFCRGSGKTKGANDEWRNCPACYGKGGEYIYDKIQTWLIIEEWSCGLTVGDIQIRYGYENKVTYMCNETGIGSGTLHDENKLFPTEEEAKAECKKRNALIIKENL